MRKITPTFYRAIDHTGKEIEIQALRCGERRRFLELFELAYQELIDNEIARAALQVSTAKAVQFGLDSEAMEDFRYCLGSMLAMLGCNMDTLDCLQITELLFDAGKGQGAYFDLEFFPSVPGGKTLSSDIDPYYQLIAIISISTNDPLVAKQTVDAMTWPEINSILQTRNEIFDRAQQEQSKPVEQKESIERPGGEETKEEKLARLMQFRNEVQAQASAHKTPEQAQAEALAQFMAQRDLEGSQAPDTVIEPKRLDPR